VDAGTVDRFGRSFEDWFFRTGDAPLARGLAFQDLRLEDQGRDKKPRAQTFEHRLTDEFGRPVDSGAGAAPMVYRPGWVWENGYWRPETEAEKNRPRAELLSDEGGRDQGAQGEPQTPEGSDPGAPPKEPAPRPAPREPVERMPLPPLKDSDPFHAFQNYPIVGFTSDGQPIRSNEPNPNFDPPGEKEIRPGPPGDEPWSRPPSGQDI
jgi:hypothetical protein